MGILRRNLVGTLLGMAFALYSAGIVVANADASTSVGMDYCKAARSFLGRQPLTSRHIGHMVIAATPSPGVLYIPVGPLAIPVSSTSSGKITQVIYIRNARGGVYGFGAKVQARFMIVPGDFIGNELRLGISREAAFGLPVWNGQYAKANSPWSPAFWEALAKKRKLDGVHLFEAIANASLSNVKCSSPSDSDWSTLYALFARHVFFFDDPSGEADTLSARVYQNWFVFRIKIKSSTPDGPTYKFLITDRKGSMAIFTVRKANRVIATGLNPVRRGAINWNKQPDWVQSVAGAIISNSPGKWEVLTHQLRAAGVVVRKAGPSSHSNGSKRKPNP